MRASTGLFLLQTLALFVLRGSRHVTAVIMPVSSDYKHFLFISLLILKHGLNACFSSYSIETTS